MSRRTVLPVYLPSCFQQELPEAGCDEVGRGCYAGPVFAAAVILPTDFRHPEINDSKQVKPQMRQRLKDLILEKALAYGIGRVEVEEIDRTNILKAAQKAMHLALDALRVKPGFIAVDGNYFIPYRSVPHTCIVKGDASYAHIAAASILAKTARDEYMTHLHAAYPQYDWLSNKGYGTKAHREAIQIHGLTQHHRRSFKIHPV